MRSGVRRSAGPADVLCPVDSGLLHWDDAGVTCLSCGRSWRRDGDVPCFADGDAPATAPEDDEPAARNDWRFLFSVEEDTRVLELGTRSEAAAIALAFEAGRVVALREHASDAVRLARRADELALDTLQSIAVARGTLPVPDTSFDRVVVHDALVRPVATGSLQAARRLLLHAIRDRLAPGGLLLAEIANRRLGPSTAGAMTLGQIRRMLLDAGFPRAEILAVLRTGGRRELVPVHDSTIFEWTTKRAGADTAWRRVRRAAERTAFRAGIVPRLADSFLVVAHRGKR